MEKPQAPWPFPRTLTQRNVADWRMWTQLDVVANPYGRVPLVRFAWRPTRMDESRGEFETITDIQDRVNSTMLDRLIISRAQAYKQRWAKGIKVEKDDDGRAKAPFDPGADSRR